LLQLRQRLVVLVVPPGHEHLEVVVDAVHRELVQVCEHSWDFCAQALRNETLRKASFFRVRVVMCTTEPGACEVELFVAFHAPSSVRFGSSFALLARRSRGRRREHLNGLGAFGDLHSKMKISAIRRPSHPAQEERRFW
ncbi:unnamed protein product, partial [Hapterophycus canaliculatus]